MNDEISSRGGEGPVAFYGRKDELQTLLSAWEAARKGKPQWVSILAETGVGKTRLVQEFYRCISSRNYLQSKGLSAGEVTDFDPDGYWPDDLPIDRDKLGLNPDPACFPLVEADKAAPPPWLWWGIRGDPRERNGTQGLCAASDALEHLNLHTARMKLLAEVKDLGGDLAKKMASAVTGGWLDVIMAVGEIVGKVARVLKLLTPDAQTPAAMMDLNRADLQDLLTKAIISFLDREIPVVLVLDDAHWLDPDTLGFIDRLIGKLPTRDTSSKLLIVSTSWKKEWNEGAAFRNSYENFSGEKPPAIELGVIDEGSARAYLKEHLPGIEESDIRLLLERAQGNFRYLTELQLLLHTTRWHFIGDDRQKLSELGRQKLKDKELDIDTCILERFNGFPDDVQLALQRSSYQGPCFDPLLTAKAVEGLQDEQSANGVTSAITHGENPGAMITTVAENLKEFLQGPYWHLIKKCLDEREGKTVKAAYDSLLMKAIEDPKMDNNKALASIALQTLEGPVELQEAVRLRGWLIKYAWNGREAHSTINHIRAVLKLGLSFGEIPPDVALVALRFRSQFGFGVKLLDPGWDRLVESHFLAAFVLPLEASVSEFEKTGALSDGYTLGDLIDRCDALVEYHRSLGHNLDYPKWLKVKIELVQKQLKALPDQIDLNATCLVDICNLVILLAQRAKTREDWDRIYELISNEAQASANKIYEFDPKVGDVYVALLQAVIFWFLRDGRKFFPGFENGFDDYPFYESSAEKLGDILAEHDYDPSDSTVSRMLGDRDFKCLEAVFSAGCYIQEFAKYKKYDLVPEFSDRLLRLSGQVFDLIARGVYAPPSLPISMLEVQLAAAQMFYRKAGKREVQREFGGVDGLPDELKSNFTTYLIAERPVGADEAQAQLQKALASIERYRELRWLPVGLLKMAAISQIELLHLTELTEKPGTDTVGRMFDQMLADAELSEDADRLAYGEPVELLQWLVMTYDKWLHGSPGCDAMWNKVRETYRIAEPKFDRLVGMIRQHQATLQ